MVLCGSANEHDRRPSASTRTHPALDLSWFAQSRLFVLVLQPAAVGYRDGRAQFGRDRTQCDRGCDLVAAGGASSRQETRALRVKGVGRVFVFPVMYSCGCPLLSQEGTPSNTPLQLRCGGLESTEDRCPE